MNEMDSRTGQGAEAVDIYEQPTSYAELAIALLPEGARPVGDPSPRAARTAEMTLRSASAVASHDVPSRAAYLTITLEPSPARTNSILAALYLEAEQARLPREPSYDIDRGFTQFSAWLDSQMEPSAEATSDVPPGARAAGSMSSPRAARGALSSIPQPQESALPEESAPVAPGSSLTAEERPTAAAELMIRVLAIPDQEAAEDTFPPAQPWGAAKGKVPP